MHMVLCDRTIGPNFGAMCSWLWTEIQAFYALVGTKDQLSDLAVAMIKPKRGSIELTGSRAEIRL